MKLRLNFVMPVLVAVSLWGVGNILALSTPAVGQEIAKNDYPSCDAYSYPVATNSTCPAAPDSNGKCSGTWSTETAIAHRCVNDGTADNGQCQPSSGDATAILTSGTCHAAIENGKLVCIQDPPTSITYVTVKNIPTCYYIVTA